jgi:hypothetical protein
VAHAALARRLTKLESRSDPKRRGGTIHLPPNVSAEKLDEFLLSFKRQCAEEGLDPSCFILLPATSPHELWQDVVREQTQHAWQHPFTPGNQHGEI